MAGCVRTDLCVDMCVDMCVDTGLRQDPVAVVVAANQRAEGLACLGDIDGIPPCAMAITA